MDRVTTRQVTLSPHSWTRVQGARSSATASPSHRAHLLRIRERAESGLGLRVPFLPRTAGGYTSWDGRTGHWCPTSSRMDAIEDSDFLRLYTLSQNRFLRHSSFLSFTTRMPKTDSDTTTSSTKSDELLAQTIRKAVRQLRHGAASADSRGQVPGPHGHRDPRVGEDRPVPGGEAQELLQRAELRNTRPHFNDMEFKLRSGMDSSASSNS